MAVAVAAAGPLTRIQLRSKRIFPVPVALRAAIDQSDRSPRHINAILSEACMPWSGRPRPRMLVRGRGPVAPATTVARDLTADRRGRATESSHGFSQRPVGGQPTGDLLALLEAQPACRPMSWDRSDPAAGQQIRPHRAVDSPSDRAVGLTACPARIPRPDPINVCWRQTLECLTRHRDLFESRKCCDDSLRAPADADALLFSDFRAETPDLPDQGRKSVACLRDQCVHGVVC